MKRQRILAESKKLTLSPDSVDPHRDFEYWNLTFRNRARCILPSCTPPHETDYAEVDPAVYRLLVDTLQSLPVSVIKIITEYNRDRCIVPQVLGKLQQMVHDRPWLCPIVQSDDLLRSIVRTLHQPHGRVRVDAFRRCGKTVFAAALAVAELTTPLWRPTVEIVTVDADSMRASLTQLMLPVDMKVVVHESLSTLVTVALRSPSILIVDDLPECASFEGLEEWDRVLWLQTPRIL
jgi:hypothetical protein